MKKLLIFGYVVIILTGLCSCFIGPSGRHVMSYRDGKVYLYTNDFYRVGALPAGWRRMKVRVHAIAFHQPDYLATISTDAFCGKGFEDLPLKLLTSHIVGDLEDYNEEKQESFMLGRRGALRTLISGKVDGVPFLFDVVTLKKDRCNIDFLLIAPKHHYYQVKQDFENFFQGFQYRDN